MEKMEIAVIINSNDAVAAYYARHVSSSLKGWRVECFKAGRPALRHIGIKRLIPQLAVVSVPYGELQEAIGFFKEMNIRFPGIVIFATLVDATDQHRLAVQQAGARLIEELDDYLRELRSRAA